MVHPDIVREMEKIDNICNDIKPCASFFNHYLTAIPSRGDIRHLLACHPLAKRMGLSIENFSHLRISPNSNIFRQYCQMNRLKNYAWFLNEQIEPAVALSETYQPSFLVLSFSCNDKLSPEFYENFLDYICSYLNQYVMGPCHIINDLLAKRLTIHESDTHSLTDSR